MHGTSKGSYDTLEHSFLLRAGAHTIKFHCAFPVEHWAQLKRTTTINALCPTQKSRGRPPGSGRKHQLASTTGGSMFNATGTMTPYIINVAVGEDIKVKVLSLLQDRRAIVVLSGVGYVAAANIKIPSSNGSVTYEGHFDMVNLSGSYINEADEPHGPTGGLTVTFMGPDGRLIGGPVEGVLIAASPVQVIVGTIMPSTPKPKNKVVDNRDTSGDQDRTLGNSTTQANIQPSQSLSTMGIWQSSR
ncbi:AT-hook motif nuclear-localized protein 9 [Striga hermonthica]|uniref:AT-hook motif nuclear-localized protein n=1 Tax=Striga hermonthica TaxID=68872 RepID=A0A9N7RA45_STRHE|nr:AT-hook motif nuclear-localized protein 9 [Striga hermonthica]